MVDYYGKFEELSLSAIRPAGWLRRYLELQAEGLTGHLEEAGYPFHAVSWADDTAAAAHTTENPGWWAYEQTAYWLDGLERTGELLGNTRLLEKPTAAFDYVLSHADEEGYLGPSFLKTSDGYNRWPHVVFFRAMMARWSVDRDERWLDAIVRHYTSDTCRFDRFRDVLNVEIMLWGYRQTGDVRLLELAKSCYRRYNEQCTDDNCCAAHRNRRKPFAHGVSYNEFAKLGAILYAYTGEDAYLQPSVNAYRKLDRYHMLVDGLHSSVEHLLGNDYMLSHETCNVTDYTWAMGYLLMATGDGAYADRIERCIFNAGIGSVDEAFKALQYFSCPNQLIADRHSNHNDFYKGEAWMSYRPNPGTECCPGNVNRFFPNYCARMWMRGKKGIAAVLYGASEVTCTVGEAPVTIREETAYPFEDTIRFTLSVAQPQCFCLSLRIPAWCATPRIAVNGAVWEEKVVNGFVHIERVFCDGDTVVLALPSEVRVCDYHGQGCFVEKGPLVYALGMRGDRQIDREEPKSSEAFPAYNIYPDKPWNYALALNVGEGAAARFIKRVAATDEPWDIDRVPCAIEVPARRVNDWELRRRRHLRHGNGKHTQSETTGTFVFTPRHPSKAFIQKHGVGDIEPIALVPMAVAKLRLTVFPIIPEE